MSAKGGKDDFQFEDLEKPLNEKEMKETVGGMSVINENINSLNAQRNLSNPSSPVGKLQPEQISKNPTPAAKNPIQTNTGKVVNEPLTNEQIDSLLNRILGNRG